MRKYSGAFYKRLRDSCADTREYVHSLFWLCTEKVEPASCWEWIGYRNKDGYGLLGATRLEGGKVKYVLAHKLSWLIHFRKYIREPMCVCHHCDNPGCVNPKHLFVGTARDNNTDRDKKGRTAWGEKKKHMAKLKKEDVRLIEKLNNLGYTQEHIAREIGVSTITVWRILHGKSWRHVSRIGTPKRNHAKGEKSGNSKLTTEKVLQIRIGYSLGAYTMGELSEMYNVSEGNVHSIISRKTWKCI